MQAIQQVEPQRPQRITLCPPRKTGSTTWRGGYFFNYLSDWHGGVYEKDMRKKNGFASKNIPGS
jgi:hypothetical protein